MFGRLTLQAFQHDPIITGAQVTMVLGALSVIGFLFYTKRWQWLWREWLTSLDPKKIGVMYIIVALVMLVRGFADAGMMRLQQALSAGDAHGFLTSDHFQQIFTAHGTIMIFFVAMGLMFGLINLVVPLQIGSRDVAFPFLNSVSFWLFVAGMMLVNLSLVVGEMAATGWLAYPPLSELAYSPGVGVDYWIWSIQIAGIGSLLSGVNFLVTIIKMRAPGMTLMKMPLFTWSVLNTMLLVIFAFPILTVTLALLALDRTMGMHFFTSTAGGNPMMYINLIWAWGHPEVYILVLPAFGIFSEVVSTFTGKRLFGYKSMVFALCAISALSYLVWLHHFFTMGAGGNVNAFFGIMTAVIAVPTGVKVFNWLFTMRHGRIRFTSPMIWFFGFVTTFTIGGVTGVLMSVPAIDFQVHNSLFLVAHFHNMIIGGVVFGYFAGLTYWFPKIFGFRLNERLGKYGAYGWIIGFLFAFIPLYILGFMGATRRLDHYDASIGWQGLFIVAGIGVMIIGIGVLFQILQLVVSIRDRKKNLDITGDPWNGRTLEWSTVSPAPSYNFAITPEVSARDDWWERKRSKNTDALKYRDIHMPKNSGLGLIIAMFAFVASFAIIWHIWWLVPFCVVVIVGLIIYRTTNDDSEYKITAAKLAKLQEEQAI
ncbi:MAG: cytochrome o ubiquinol oxidase subunit I [Candidatus Saccharibacteria bacterium]|nr:cytochrome o ubiquinol oxidase subunit I [Candidatus Saccharibacteria bacterium]